eukprot:8182908-Lingulodinium_polyedra.AAC.1
MPVCTDDKAAREAAGNFLGRVRMVVPEAESGMPAEAAWGTTRRSGAPEERAGEAKSYRGAEDKRATGGGTPPAP